MQPEPRKTLYVVWGENIGNGGIFDSQVAELLLALHRRGRSIALLVGLPVPALIRHALRTHGPDPFEAALKKLRRLRAAGISVYVRWLRLAPNFYAKLWQLPLYYAGQIRFVRELARRENIGAFHCRSYHAALLCSLANRGLERKLIFDPRGLFPEEGVLYKRLRAGGASFRGWKALEHKLLRAADATVALSTPFAEHLRAIDPSARIEVIPAGARIEHFTRRIRPANATTLTLVFLGAFDPGQTWYYSVRALAEVTRSFQSVFGSTFLRVITASPHAPLAAALLAHGLPRDMFELTRTSDLAQTAELLRKCDLAIYPFNPRLARARDPILTTILGSKTGEYLACGLPLITTAAVGAIATLIRNRKLGVCLSSADLNALDPADVGELRALLRGYDETQRRCLDAAIDLGFERVASRYDALYDSLEGHLQSTAAEAFRE
jgi:glycosyltransferase involved in cell wall biosynthesis